MPIQYKIHPQHRAVVTRFTGTVDDEAFVDSYRRMLHAEEYVPGTNELADLRELAELQVSAVGLRKVEAITEARYAGTGADFRTAIIAPRDHAYGLARMYEVFAEGGPEHVLVCRTRQEAFEWLGLDPDCGILDEPPGAP